MMSDVPAFQYRKRYGLHAIPPILGESYGISVSIPQAVWIACNSKHHFRGWVLTPFQYRKRYGLHAMAAFRSQKGEVPRVSIPQAVWIACNEDGSRACDGLAGVSIPQAVWIACNDALVDVKNPKEEGFNTASGMDCMQYCLPEPLKTVNPKGDFLVRPPFCTFPQTSGNFFVAKSGLKWVRSQPYQGKFCPRKKI